MILTIEERQVLRAFFQRYRFFTSGCHWPFFVDAMITILNGNGIAWGVRNDFAVFQLLDDLIGRDECLLVLLQELSVNRERQRLVWQNSKNQKLNKSFAAKLASITIKLKQMFEQALSQ